MNDDPTTDTLESFFEQWDARLVASIRRRVPDGGTAHEIAQEVWVAICQLVGDGPVPANLAQLLFGTATHKIADWYRSNIPRSAAVPLDPLLAELAQSPDPRLGPGESPLDHLSERMLDALDELDRVLPRLTVSQRNAVLYRHYLGMSVAEVAEAMGVTHNAAKRFLVRGMDKIRTLLRQAGYEISVSTKEMP